MTLQQYINQKDPERMPIVYLTKSEYKIAGTITDVMGNKKTRVFISFPAGSFDGMRNEYVMHNESNRLYTTDADGNSKNLSCFRVSPLK